MFKRKKEDIEEQEKQGTTLEDFVVPQKVRAFSEAYEGVDDERMATDIFDDARLRQFFKAYPNSMGDPLTIYLDRLEDNGFRLQVSATGEPAIFVTEKPKSGLLEIPDVL